MKNIFPLTILIIVNMTNTNAQRSTATNANYTYATVPTQFVEANDIKIAYRSYGKEGDIPIIFLNHLAATMDNCDPRIMDGLAKQHQIICFDNRGVGATKGTTPKTIAEMAKDAIAFIHALGYSKVDLVGFSLGGFISQESLQQEPQLVRKAVIAGTGPAGGEGIKRVTGITYNDIFRGLLTFRDAKFYLFFNQNKVGKKSAKEFLSRLKERTENRDKKMGVKNFQNQLKAIHAWGLQAPQNLSVIKQPVLVANGDNDRMVPSSNTTELKNRIPNSEIIIYKDAGHGGIFQYHEEFVKSALKFLEQ